jgi:hypothetical protein
MPKGQKGWCRGSKGCKDRLKNITSNITGM